MQFPIVLSLLFVRVLFTAAAGFFVVLLFLKKLNDDRISQSYLKLRQAQSQLKIINFYFSVGQSKNSLLSSQDVYGQKAKVY